LKNIVPAKPVSEKKRIVLVDDHPLLRQGIGQLINATADLEVCGEAGSRAEAMEVIQRAQPDLAVVDLSLKHERGLELVKDLRVQQPGVRVLVLSMHDEDLYAERVLRAGARGYIMKQEAADKVIEAIRCVLSGSVYVSERISRRIVHQAVGAPAGASRNKVAHLSDRELEILLLIGKGHGNQRIARQLFISVKTVETHRANLRQKLGLASGADLLQHAIHWAQEAGEF
jgi:DNA-binding NarL/FixJ family response regulator